MPKVPTYNPMQINQTGVPNPVANPMAMGAGQSQLLSRTGEVLGDMANVIYQHGLREREKLNRALAREALTNAQRDIDDILFGDDGLYSRQGKDTVNLIEDAQKSFEDVKKTYRKGLTDQLAQDLFNASYDDFMTRNLHSLSIHRSKQIEKYNQDTLDAQNLQIMDNAVKNRFDPEIINQAVQDIRANTNAKYQGMGDDVKKQAVQDVLNFLHSNVLEALGNDNPDAALAYLDKYSDQMRPNTREKFRASLQAESDKIWVHNKVLEISESGKTFEKQLAMVDKIKDPDKAKEIRTIVKQRYADKKAIEQIKYDQFEDDEWHKLFADPVNYDPPVGQLEPGTYMAMVDEKRKILNAALKMTVPEEKNLLSYELRAMPATEFAKMSKEELFRHRANLHPKDFEIIFKEWKDAQESPEKIDQLRSPLQFANAQISMLGDLKYREKDDKEKDREKRIRRQRFFTEFDKRIRQIPEEQQTEEKMMEIANYLLSPFYTELTGPDKFNYRFEIPYLEMDKKERIELMGYRKNIPENLKDTYQGKFKITYEYNDLINRYAYHVHLGPDKIDLYDEEGTLLGHDVGM